MKVTMNLTVGFGASHSHTEKGPRIHEAPVQHKPQLQDCPSTGLHGRGSGAGNRSLWLSAGEEAGGHAVPKLKGLLFQGQNGAQA